MPPNSNPRRLPIKKHSHVHMSAGVLNFKNQSTCLLYVDSTEWGELTAAMLQLDVGFDT